MSLPKGLPQVSDTGNLLGALDYNLVDDTGRLTATTAAGTPATGLFHSTVVNRASIPDLTKDLGVRMGIERIMTESIYQLQDEFGPNGEPVWGILNDDAGRIRIVGSVDSVIGGQGQYIRLYNSGNDYLEISFYGTGLNILLTQPGAIQEAYYTVDGGYTVSNFVPTMSGIISGRNYSANIVCPVVTGLSLGIHTIKISVPPAPITSAFLHFHGFEIINEQLLSTTANTNSNTSLTSVASTSGLTIGMSISGTGIPANATIAAISGSTITMSAAATATATGIAVKFGANFIKVNPGTTYNNGATKYTSSQQTSAYNSNFDSIARDGSSVVSLGSKGGRVLVYQKADGTVGKSATAVNTSIAYSTSTSHTYEEIVRTHYPREFGMGRADDFSYVAPGGSANLAFTLDDGTTTLVGQGVGFANEGVSVSANNGFLTITFVGTGLDVERFDDVTTAGPETQYTYSVDGVSQGSFGSTGSTAKRIQKIVSGLPYGTHTFRFSRGTPIYFTPRFSKFIVYGPKKPTLPMGAVELADYNIMADYSPNTTVGVTNTSIGILRKTPTRELIYVNGATGNAWGYSGGALTLIPTIECGFQLDTNRNNGYFEYTFFGTGFELRTGIYSTHSNNITVLLNGSQLNASYSGAASINVGTLGTGMTYGGASGTSFALSTVASNILNTNGVAATSGCAFRVWNLPLGLHKIRMTNNNNPNYLPVDALDIITPIHSPKSNLPVNLQNTLPVGNCAISDNRVTVSTYKDSTTSKAWAQAVAVTSSPTYTTPSSGNPVYAPLPDMSCTVKTSGGALEITFSSSFIINNAGAGVSLAIYIDGSYIRNIPSTYAASTIAGSMCSVRYMHKVPAGVHKVDVYWGSASNSVTMTASSERILTVREL